MIICQLPSALRTLPCLSYLVTIPSCSLLEFLLRGLGYRIRRHQQQILTFISQCLGYPVQGSVTDVRIVGNTEILQVWIPQAVEVRLTASPSCKQVRVTIAQCNWEQDLPVASTPWKLLFKIFK